MAKSAKKKKAGKPAKKNRIGKFEIRQRWDLPPILKEISGISFIDDERFACVQDEIGSIFIFNRGTGKVEKEIAFADKGDYEGITWTGESFFVIRSDGMLIEVSDPWDEEPGITFYETGFGELDNVESVGYDSFNNRLLLTRKVNKNHKRKRVLAFLLESRSMATDPAFVIDLNDLAFIKPDNTRRNVRASAIGIHPVTGDVYIPDGPKSRLLIVSPVGKVIALYKLNAEQVPQPEGISFNENGEIFISTEGKGMSAAILSIELVQ